VNGVLADVTYRPGWSFETTVLPDGNSGVLVVAELEDLNHPGRVFRTSRIAPLLASGHSAPVRVILEGVLRGVLAIEEDEAREQLRYRGGPAAGSPRTSCTYLQSHPAVNQSTQSKRGRRYAL